MGMFHVNLGWEYWILKVTKTSGFPSFKSDPYPLGSKRRTLWTLLLLDMSSIESSFNCFWPGYVNFHSVSDAERALDTLNYSSIKACSHCNCFNLTPIQQTLRHTFDCFTCQFLTSHFLSPFWMLTFRSDHQDHLVLGPCLPHHVEPTRPKPSQELLGGIDVDSRDRFQDLKLGTGGSLPGKNACHQNPTLKPPDTLTCYSDFPFCLGLLPTHFWVKCFASRYSGGLGNVFVRPPVNLVIHITWSCMKSLSSTCIARSIDSLAMAENPGATLPITMGKSWLLTVLILIFRSEIWTVTLTTKRCTIPSASSGTSSLARSGWDRHCGAMVESYAIIDFGSSGSKGRYILDPEMTRRRSSLTLRGVHFAWWKVSWLRLCHLEDHPMYPESLFIRFIIITIILVYWPRFNQCRRIKVRASGSYWFNVYNLLINKRKKCSQFVGCPWVPHLFHSPLLITC